MCAVDDTHIHARMHAGLTHRRGCIEACACVIWTHTHAHTRLYCVGISSVTHVILVCLSSPPRPTLVVRGSVAKRRQVKLKLCITSIELFSPRPLRLDQTDTEFSRIMNLSMNFVRLSPGNEP